MNPLMSKLLERNLIVDGMVLTGGVYTSGLGQTQQKVRKELLVVAKKSNHFVCQDILERRYGMLFNDVEMIDGMDTKRFASVYNIKADGSDRKVGKKRGRKPKNLLNNTQAAETNNGKNQRAKDHHQVE